MMKLAVLEATHFFCIIEPLEVAPTPASPVLIKPTPSTLNPKPHITHYISFHFLFQYPNIA